MVEPMPDQKGMTMYPKIQKTVRNNLKSVGTKSEMQYANCRKRFDHMNDSFGHTSGNHNPGIITS